MFSLPGRVHGSDSEARTGKLKRKACMVKFTMITPKNLETCPFVVLISRGKHTHPPPPPCKTPTDIQKCLTTMIKNAHEDVMPVTVKGLLSSKYIQYIFIIVSVCLYIY